MLAQTTVHKDLLKIDLQKRSMEILPYMLKMFEGEIRGSCETYVSLGLSIRQALEDYVVASRAGGIEVQFHENFNEDDLHSEFYVSLRILVNASFSFSTCIHFRMDMRDSLRNEVAMQFHLADCWMETQEDEKRYEEVKKFAFLLK